MKRKYLAGLIGLALLPGAVPVEAAKPPPPRKPIRMSIKPTVTRSRSQAPQTLEIGLDCDPDRYFEGRLDIKWYLGKRLVHEYLSPELAVAPGGRRMRIALPPIVVHSEKTPVTAYARFLTRDEVIELPEADLVVPVVSKRAFVVAGVKPQDLKQPQAARGIAESLGLEQFNPYPDMQLEMLTYPARLTPEELPLVSSAYASFDCLVLDGEGFQQLLGGQLAAIADWLAAGGRVVVMPARGLSADHIAFLNRISGLVAAGERDSPAGQAGYALDEQRGLVIGPRALAVGKKLARYRSGLGRVVIVHEPLDPQTDFASRDWKAAVMFLWALRASQRDVVREAGCWRFARPEMPFGYANQRWFAPEPDDLAESLRRFLLPERIEGVPFSVVVVILSLFLLAIAPGDYLLLGRLNCRKYTWWLFFAVSASFTLFTVKIADSYMGHSDFRTSLTFVDVAGGAVDSPPQARVARTSRFEMLFTASQQTIERALRNALYVDLTEWESLQARRLKTHRPLGFSDDAEFDLTDSDESDLPVFEGALPVSFTVHQQMRQWSPRVTRQTALGDDRELLAETAIDWPAIRSDALHTPEGRQALYDAVRARAPEALVVLLHGKQAFDPAHNEDAAATSGQLAAGFPIAPGSALEGAPPVISLAARISMRSKGLFAIVSRIAPTGAENLEDLALLDDGDPQQWLLIVAVRRENNWIVYRRLFEEGRP